MLGKFPYTCSVIISPLEWISPPPFIRFSLPTGASHVAWPRAQSQSPALARLQIERPRNEWARRDPTESHVCSCAMCCVLCVLCVLCVRQEGREAGAVMALIARTTGLSRSATSVSQCVSAARSAAQRIGGVGGSRKPLRERRLSCSRMRPERRDGVLQRQQAGERG